METTTSSNQDRRQWLLASGVLASGLALSKNSQAAGNDEAPDLFKVPPPARDVHFLNRISYGVTADARKTVKVKGWKSVLAQQLNYQSIDDSELENFLSDNLQTLNLSSAEIINNDQLRQQAARDLIIATILRRIFSPRQLYERMVEFWSDHFNVSIRDGIVQFLKTAEDREVIRPNAMGRFRDILHANAKSPAMLYYLDNYSNTSTGPNENYARELMELHTLGVDGGYTENDVIEVARCFTGWTISRRTVDFIFSPFTHDYDEKFVLGESIPAGGGLVDAEQVLDILADHPSTARFICTKLARRFVSDDPNDKLVNAMTDTFSATDGDISAVLDTMFQHNLFWKAKDQKFKRPQDLLISTMRHLGFQVEENVLRLVAERLEVLGQQVFSWPSPDGYPDVAGYWTNTGALITRWNTASAAAFAMDEAELEERLNGARSPNRIISAMAQNVIQRTISPQDLDVLRRNLFAGLPVNQPVPDDNQLVYARIVLTALLSSRYFQNR